MAKKHRKSATEMKADRARIEAKLRVWGIEWKSPTPIQIAARVEDGAAVNYYLSSGTYHIAGSIIEEKKGPDNFLEFIEDLMAPERPMPYKIVTRK